MKKFSVFACVPPVQTLKQSSVGESYWSVNPGSRSEDREAKERKQSQHKEALLILSLLWKEVAWYHKAIWEAVWKVFQAFHPKGKGAAFCTCVCLSHQAKVHPTRSQLYTFQVVLEQPLPNLIFSVQPRVIDLGPWWGAVRLHLSADDQGPWIAWNVRLRGPDAVGGRYPTQSIPCNTEICLHPPLCVSPLLWNGVFVVVPIRCFHVSEKSASQICQRQSEEQPQSLPRLNRRRCVKNKQTEPKQTKTPYNIYWSCLSWDCDYYVSFPFFTSDSKFLSSVANTGLSEWKRI